MRSNINELVAHQDGKAIPSKVKPRNSKTLRRAIHILADMHNARVEPERRVTRRDVETVAARSLTRTKNLEHSSRYFAAYKEVASFLHLAIDGKGPIGLAQNRDLLPIGHPLSVRPHSMLASAYSDAVARWIAADPLIDESARDLVSVIYSSEQNSVENLHARTRLMAMAAGAVPQEVLINASESIVAVAGLGLGGNSRAARSARARLQRRDRNGKFAEEGGGMQFFFRGLDGLVSSVVGRFVANAKDIGSYQVEVKNDPNVPDGIYEVETKKAAAVKALIPAGDDKDIPSGITLPEGIEAVSAADLKKVDVPEGWTLASKQKQHTWDILAGGPEGPDEVYVSGDGYRVDVYFPNSKETAKAVNKAWKFNTKFGSALSDPPSIKNADGDTKFGSKLDKTKPVYIMYRDVKDLKISKSVSIAQSWADTQEFAEKDEKDFDKEIEKALNFQKNVEEEKAKSKAEAKAYVEQAEQVMKENDLVRAEIKSNLESNKDVYGNPLPEGWKAEIKEDALNPGPTINITLDGKQGNYTKKKILKDRTATYSKSDRKVNSTVIHDPDVAGKLKHVETGKNADDWDGIEQINEQYIKDRSDQSRDAAKKAVESYDEDGSIAKMIDDGAEASAVLAKLKENKTWAAELDDYSTSQYVDLPSAAQKAKWQAFGNKLNAVNRMLDPYTEKEQSVEIPDNAIMFDPNGDIDVQLQKALADDAPIVFDYNDKTRVVNIAKTKSGKPSYWINPKNDNVNVVGTEVGKTEKKNFTLSKMKKTGAEPDAAPELDGYDKYVKDLRTEAEESWENLTPNDYKEWRQAYKDDGNFIGPGDSSADVEKMYVDDYVKQNKLSRDEWEKKQGPEPKAVIPDAEVAPKQDAAKPIDMQWTVPDGAYKLQKPEDFEPEGRTDQESKDYTDDPKVIANKFQQATLENAFAQAVRGYKDSEIDIDNLEEDSKKKPDPKEDDKLPVASGFGALEFDSGEEWVPAESIYGALKEQGVDVDMLLASLYDLGTGESKNTDLLMSLRKDEGVKAQEPSVILDDFDKDSTEIIEQNEKLARPQIAANSVAQLNDLVAKGESNESIKQVGNDIADVDPDTDVTAFLTKYIAWGVNGNDDEKQAFRGLFAVLLSADGGYSTPGQESMLSTALSDALEKYNGVKPEQAEVDAIYNEFGQYKDLVKSKKALNEGAESVDDKDSLAGSFYRLLAVSSKPNATEIYRGIQVSLGSKQLADLTEQNSVIAIDPRSFSNDKLMAGKFAGIFGENPDKAAVIFTIPAGNGLSTPIDDISMFDAEGEHIAWGNYKIVETKTGVNKAGKTLYNVKLEVIDKRASVLQGYDNDYKDLLIENKIPEDFPDAYYFPSDDPYVPAASDEDKAAGLDDDPLYISRTWETDDLVQAFIGAVEGKKSSTLLQYPVDGGTQRSVPTEAIRDALQIQGVDTNSLLNDMADISKIESSEDFQPVVLDEVPIPRPAAESVVSDIVEESTDMYDMDGWKKVGPQLGSNEGGFYEDADGNRYYVKVPKSDLHAENETLASALYRALGINAAEIYMGSGPDKKKKTLSPDIKDSKQDFSEKLNDKEYLAKVQEGFAVDAWLANWDVAGLTFDNVMTDGDGNPVRVDPGGALLFRAQGAPKGTYFGNEATELDTLRNKSMNPQSAKIFGSMTEEQQKDSAAKLLDISHDDIDLLVNSIISDQEKGQEIKDKLKARRQYILDRYGLSSEDASITVENNKVEDDDAAKPAVNDSEDRLETAVDWAEEYSDLAKTAGSEKDSKQFDEIANQIDVALIDYRNGDITDEQLPTVLDELTKFIETYSWESGEVTESNAEDLADQISLTKKNIKPSESVVEETPKPKVPSESPTNPYVTADGVPIEPGMKLKYKKTGEIVDFVKYDKGNASYVYVKDSAGKTKVKSTKQLESTSDAIETPKAEESKAETPAPAVEKTDVASEYTKVDREVKNLKPGDLLPKYYPTAGGEKNLLKKREQDPGYEMPPADEVVKLSSYKGQNPKKVTVTVRDLKTGEERKFEVNRTAKIYDVRTPKAKAPQAEEPKTETPKVIGPEPESVAVVKIDASSGVQGQIEKAIEDKKQISFFYNGKDRTVLPVSVWTNPKNGNVNMYAIDNGDSGKKKNFTISKIENPLNAEAPNVQAPAPTPASDTGKTPAVEAPAVEEKPEPKKLQLHAQMVKDVLAQQGINITDEKAIEVRDVIDENGTIDKWGTATDAEVHSAILDVVGPGLVDLEASEDETPAETPVETVEKPSEPPKAPEGVKSIPDSNGNDVFPGVSITDKKGKKGVVQKVNKDNYAFIQFEDGTTGFRSAKTISTTGEVNLTTTNKAKKAPKPGKATPAGAPLVVVDNPAGWDQSNFENTPSMLDAIESVQNPEDKAAAMRGASFATDSDSVEDLDVRVMRVRDKDGNDGVRFKFKLTAWAGNQKAKELIDMTPEQRKAAGIETGSMTIDRIDIGPDGVGQISAVKNAYQGAGRTWTITTKDGIVIKFNRANSDSTSKTAGGSRAFHNLVQIQAPAGVTTEQISEALRTAGVQDVRPATPDDARILIENRLMSIFDGKTDATKNLKGADREASLARVKAKYDITADDVVITVGASGRIETRLSKEKAQKIVDATKNPSAILHNISSGYEGKVSYSDSQEVRNEARAAWLVNLLATPQGGLLSTTTRWTEGIGTHGMSSGSDVGTGGADYVFTKPVKNMDKKVYGVSDSDAVIYFDPLKVYQRLDFYANYTDSYGKRSSTQDIISAAKVGAYEVMFKNRLGFDEADSVVLSPAIRKLVLEKLRQRGITEIGGRPIDVVIVSGTETKS